MLTLELSPRESGKRVNDDISVELIEQLISNLDMIPSALAVVNLTPAHDFITFTIKHDIDQNIKNPMLFLRIHASEWLSIFNSIKFMKMNKACADLIKRDPYGNNPCFGDLFTIGSYNCAYNILSAIIMDLKTFSAEIFLDDYSGIQLNFQRYDSNNSWEKVIISFSNLNHNSLMRSYKGFDDHFIAKTVIDHLDDQVTIMDLDGRILDMNKSALNFTFGSFGEFSSKHMRGFNGFEFVPPELHKPLKAAISKVVHTSTSITLTERILDLQLSIALVPLCDPYGRCIGICTIAREIKNQSEKPVGNLMKIVEEEIPDAVSLLPRIESNQKIKSSEEPHSLFKFGLSPTEIKVTEHVRKGYTAAKIASSLGTSIMTIHSHTRNIRKKLGLTNSGINLQVFLDEYK